MIVRLPVVGLLLTLSLAILVIVTPGVAVAQLSIVDQQSVGDISAGWSIRFLSPIGQSFTPTKASLDAVRLRVADSDTTHPFPATLVVRIRQTTIDGPIVGTSTSVLVPFGTDGTVPTQFDFPTAVPLTRGQLHVIEVVQLAGNGNSAIGGLGGYTGGHAIIGGEVLSFEDLWFQEGSRVAPPVTSVAIDLKPGDDNNQINLKSAGVVPVAILSDATFDAAQVDPETITLAGARVRMVGKANAAQCHMQDVNRDGLPDLVCNVETAEMLIEPGSSLVVLEAETFTGILIQGQDFVEIVP